MKNSKTKIVICTFCQKKLTVYESKLRRNKNNHLFCNSACYFSAIQSKLIIKTHYMTSEVKEKIAKANKGRTSRLGAILSDDSKRKIGEKAKARFANDPSKNPMYGKKHTEDTKNKMSSIVTEQILSGKRRPHGNNHMCGTHTSTKTNKEMLYRSSWELACMKWFDTNENVKTYMYEPFRIAYVYDDGERSHIRHYIPDFLVEFGDSRIEMWEIKPRQFINSRKCIVKTIAAREYCVKNEINEYRVLTKEDLLFMNILN